MKNKDNIIKIISGWSNTGGSTESFINLTNFLNDFGYNTIFYGPHNYHLDKCKSDLIGNCTINSNDILITHFITLLQRPNCKRIILNCHEKNIFNINNITKYWDLIVFITEEQRLYHNYTDKYDIIPNIKFKFDKVDKPNLDNIAGIIGTIDRNKQTHISIKRALLDKCDKIYIFGEIRDNEYYLNEVKPLIDNNKIIYYGFVQNKQYMYNMIGRVYHSSISEVASLVKDECESTNTKFFGNSSTDIYKENISNEEIINKWINVLFSEK